MRTLKFAMGVTCVAVLAACGGGGEGAATISKASAKPELTRSQAIFVDSRAVLSTKTETEQLRNQGLTRLRPAAALVRLGPLPDKDEKKMARDSARDAIHGGPVQVGVPRDVAATSGGMASLLNWQPTPNGGHVAAVNFQADGARGVRVGLVINGMPEGTVLRFYAPERADAKTVEVSARQIQQAIERNQAAGDQSEAGRTYWSPDFDGQATVVEFELAPGANPAAVQVTVPRISHYFTSVKDATNPQVISNRAAANCNVDAVCRPEVATDSNAVAKMRFVKNGDSFVCTGTLIGDQQQSQTPYFLTANHCIAEQTVASTLTLDWFYRSAECDAGTPSPQTTQTAGGAVLLYNAATTDTAFLRLNETPPAGTSMAGWTNGPVAEGAAVVGLHHPTGDLLKFSAGTSRGIFDYGQQFPNPDGTHIGIVWGTGITERGSSGSGLFWNDNGRRYLVGQLHGGSSYCHNPSGMDFYGRLDIAFNNGLKKWLLRPEAQQPDSGTPMPEGGSNG